jgi:hypothetical protein
MRSSARMPRSASLALSITARLFAADCQSLAALCATALQHETAVLRAHPHEKAMRLLPVSRIRLKSTLALHFSLRGPSPGLRSLHSRGPIAPLRFARVYSGVPPPVLRRGPSPGLARSTRRAPLPRSASLAAIPGDEPSMLAFAFGRCQRTVVCVTVRSPRQLKSCPSKGRCVWSLPKVFHTCGKNCGN